MSRVLVALFNIKGVLAALTPCPKVAVAVRRVPRSPAMHAPTAGRV